MVYPKTLCDDISSSDYGATDKASFSLSFFFLCLATAITGLAFILLVVEVAFSWPWSPQHGNESNYHPRQGQGHLGDHDVSWRDEDGHGYRQVCPGNKRRNLDYDQNFTQAPYWKKILFR
ncbi:hypothetical protein AVEN_53147-1, partial [Araneus ventricosus]